MCPTVRQPTDDSNQDWATNLAIDVIALAHALTYRDALHSISNLLRAARVAGQQDAVEGFVSFLVSRDTPPRPTEDKPDA